MIDLKTSQAIRMQAVRAGVRTAGWTAEQLEKWARTNAPSVFEGREPANDEPEAVVEEAPKPATRSPLEQAIVDVIRDVLPGALDRAPLDEGRVIELVRQHSAAPTIFEIHDFTTGEVRDVGVTHYAFGRVLRAAMVRRNIYLCGPAGSGKTTLAMQAAKALGLAFHFTGAVQQPHKLVGFIDAGGTYHTTEFRRAFENGGIFLFDEIDGSSAAATLCFNAALANRVMDFPDGTIEAHPDFVAIAGANTVGRGADRVYVGRNQLDGATLDRFVNINIDYDVAIEDAAAAAVFAKFGGTDETLLRIWVAKDREVRTRVSALKLRVIVSPRASIDGAALLAVGAPLIEVAEDCLWKGMAADQRAQLGGSD